MKSTNFLISIFLFVTLLMFSGCGNEEKVLPVEDAVRLISKMYLYEGNMADSRVRISTNENEYVEQNSVTVMEFRYRYDEQNRVTEIIISSKCDNDSLIVTIIYPDKNTIVVSYSNPSDKRTYILNNDGYVMSCYHIFGLEVSYTYDDGYLQKTEHPSSWPSVSSFRSSTSAYTWENGNIKTVVDEITTWTVPSQPVFVTTSVTTYEYSSVRYVPLPYFIGFGTISELFKGSLPLKFGKSVLNMPSKRTIQVDNGNEGIMTYRYETDEKDYPIKIFVQENDEREFLRSVIEYKDCNWQYQKSNIRSIKISNNL